MNEEERDIVQNHVDRLREASREVQRERRILQELQTLLCDEDEELQLNPPRIVKEEDEDAGDAP